MEQVINPFGMRVMTGNAAKTYVNITTGATIFLAAHLLGRYFGVDLMEKAENLVDSATNLVGITPKVKKQKKESETRKGSTLSNAPRPTAIPVSPYEPAPATPVSASSSFFVRETRAIDDASIAPGHSEELPKIVTEGEKGNEDIIS